MAKIIERHEPINPLVGKRVTCPCCKSVIETEESDIPKLQTTKETDFRGGHYATRYSLLCPVCLLCQVEVFSGR